MKSIYQNILHLIVALVLLFPLPLSAQEADNTAGGDDNKEEKPLIIPPARRPNKGDSGKCAERSAEDDSSEDDAHRRDTLKYGITTEVTSLLTTLTNNDDPRYVDDVYDMFQTTRSPDVQEKSMAYFAKFNDPCLADFAVTTLNNYFDARTNTVNAALKYVGDVKCHDAIPAITIIINDGDERFWQAAMTAMGAVGGGEEAAYLTELFNDEAEEMSISKKQSLVRALGSIHATDTWDALTAMAENEDENTFVRMYAAEAIGNMGLVESIPVLEGLYAASDPNLREYAIKGLENFKDNKDAKRTIIEAVKDAHPKVRIEAINAASRLSLTDAVPLLVFRAKTDDTASVKKAAFTALAELGGGEAQKFLTDLLSDPKAIDSAKKDAAEALLKAGDAGDAAIADAAIATLADDRKKLLRRTLGTVIAHYDKSAFAAVCKAYLESKDSDTVSLGLDMYKRGKYASATDAVQKIAETKGGNKARAMKILGIKEEKPSS